MKARSWAVYGAAWLIAAALALPAAARSVLEFDVAQQPVPLLDWGDAWIGPNASTGPEAIVQDPSIPWTPTQPGAVYPLGKDHVLWIRFTVPPAPDLERWYLEIPYPSLDRVTLYALDASGEWSPQVAGDSVAVGHWPVPHRHPLLPLSVSAEEPRKYLLRIENHRVFAAPLRFISESYFSLNEQRTSLVLGMYFGFAVLAAGVALLSAMTLRDRAYGTTALAVTLMGLTHASFSGIAGLHLWHLWPWWNDMATTVLPILATGAMAWCCLSIVSMPQRSWRWHRALRAVAFLCVPVAALSVLVDPGDRYRVLVPYVLATAAAALAAIGWAAGRGDRHALWLLAASVPALVGAAFPLARTLGLVPLSFWTTFSLQIGSAVQWPILLFILVRRSQQRREQRRRVQGIDRIDPATGLVNRYEFQQRLMRVIKRAQRLKYQSAVLLVDIVNMEQLREEYGRRSADEMPVRAAGRLLSAMRDIDTVARLSEFRFGVLVEGPLTPREAAALAPRVIAQFLMPFDNKPVQWVAHAQVASALVPLDGSVADTVVERLEAVLNSIPLNSRQKVFTLTASDTGRREGRTAHKAAAPLA